MGLFDFFKKPKSEVEQYYEQRNARETQQPANNPEFAAETSRLVNDNAPFCIEVQDVFTITGRGTVITGQVASGSVRVGDTVTLLRTDGTCREVVIAGIEMFRKLLDIAQAGDNVGLLLRGLTKNDISRGDILTK